MPISQTTSNISISAINAFSDNYIWCIKAKDNLTAVLVDPGDADVCIDYIEKQGLILTDILITHRHPDHVGGVNKLKMYCEHKNWPLTIYGPTLEATEFCQVQLKGDDKILLKNLDVAFTVIDVPGHTLGHIAYLIEENLFCGDTLFSAGCGRVFDGTYEQLHSSLNKLANLPEETQIFCAHEYTLSNIDFALAVDPDNRELISFYNQSCKRRDNSESTIPTSIAVEKKINPFLRCYEQTIQDSAQQYCTQPNNNKSMTRELATFTILRRWKNEF
jgi:hydroxyacylglutathione hydrolase